MNLASLEAAPRRATVRNVAGVDAETWALALVGLRAYFTKYGEDLTRNFAARYEFDLQEVREYWNEKTFVWNVLPIEADSLKVPTQRVVEEIPQNDDWAYRGMSWEEWQATRKSGFIQSRGTYNIGQEGMTMLSEKADSAAYYASGFAPVGFLPAKRRPGVVIAIPRDLTFGSNESLWKEGQKSGLIPQGERALRGRLPEDEIVAVWYIIPTRIRAGTMDLIYNRQGRGVWSEGSSYGVSVSRTTIQVYPEQML